MEDLIELTNLLTPQKISQIEILSKETDMSSQSGKLLHAIRCGEISTDEEAMEFLYNGINKEAYKKVKNRLKDRLLNTVLFIDQNQKNIGVDERFEVYRIYSIIMILYAKQKSSIANKLALRLLKKAEKFAMNDVILLLSSKLKENYLVWTPNHQKFSFYKNKSNAALSTIKTHDRLIEIWAKLGNLLMISKSSKVELDLEELDKELKVIGAQVLKEDHCLSVNKYYTSLVFLNWIKEDFEEQRKITSQALHYLEQYKDIYPVPHIAMYVYKAVAELNLQDYNKSEQTLYECLEEYKMTPGKYHWFNTYNYLFLLKMIKKDYLAAVRLLSDVVSLKGYKKMEGTWRQPWLIKEAFINILIKIGKIDKEEIKDVPLRQFRVNKFLNDVPLYSKDKRGSNTSILIAQYIYLLAENKSNDLIERLDALNQYCHRYLRNDHTYRSNCFIKMLMKVPQAGFHPIRVRNHTKALWKKLQNAPLKISEQSYEVEIIPYEDLWEIVLEILDNKKNKLTK